MGMDGLSMANTGMLREATSRDYAFQTEEAISKEEENKQVDQVLTQMKVKEDGHNGGANQQEKKSEEEDDEASVYESSSEENNEESNSENYLKLSKEDLENHTFYVKITKDGETFELYDKESNRLVEKISASEINQLMLKLNMASGILVNRSI